MNVNINLFVQEYCMWRDFHRQIQEKEHATGVQSPKIFRFAKLIHWYFGISADKMQDEQLSILSFLQIIFGYTSNFLCIFTEKIFFSWNSWISE